MATDVVGNTASNDVGAAVGGDCFGVSKPDPVMSFITGATGAGVDPNLVGVKDNGTLGLNAWNMATTAIFSVSTTTTGTAPFSGPLSNQRLTTTRPGAANGGCVVAFNVVTQTCVFNPSAVTTLSVDNLSGLDGYYMGEFFAQDDAGNRSATISRRAVADRQAPALDGVSVFGLSSLPFGSAANFTSGVIDNVDAWIGGITTIYGGAFPAYRYPHKVLNTLFGTPKTASPIVDGPAVLARSISTVPYAHTPFSHAMSWAIDAGENMATGTPTAISGALVPAGNGAAVFANVATWTVAASAAGNLSRDGLSGGGTPTSRTFTATLTLGAGNINPFTVVQLYWQDQNGMRRFIGNASTVTNPAAGTWTFAFTWNPSATDVPEDLAQIHNTPLAGTGVVALGIDNASIPATGRGDALVSAASPAFNIVR
jgi:hypothetical protein